MIPLTCIEPNQSNVANVIGNSILQPEPQPALLTDLQSWLDYIESIHPAHIQMGLDRTKKVANALGLLTFLPCITVAGTNGKGSTVETLASIYHQAGYKVGAYSSPHLYVFNERIKIQNTKVSDEVLIEAFKAIEKARGESALTFFEYTTLAALLIFKQANLDLVILEVGMGGRLDSVNVVNPILSIISSIGKDHTQYLGDTLDSIALEKAGISRSGVPLVLGTTSHLCAQHAPQSIIYQQGKDFDLKFSNENEQEAQFTYNGASTSFKLANLPLPSQALALCAIELLQERFKVAPEVIQKGLNAAHLPGRFEVIKKDGKPTIILDVAHNPDAAVWLKNKILNYPTQGLIRAVWSSMADKDVHTILFQLKSLIDDWYVSELNSPRSIDKAKLLSIISKLDSAQYFENIKAAFLKAYQEAHPSDTIVVFGSFLVLSELMQDQSIKEIIS